jgi:hypothetical protein
MQIFHTSCHNPFNSPQKNVNFGAPSLSMGEGLHIKNFLFHTNSPPDPPSITVFDVISPLGSTKALLFTGTTETDNNVLHSFFFLPLKSGGRGRILPEYLSKYCPNIYQNILSQPTKNFFFFTNLTSSYLFFWPLIPRSMHCKFLLSTAPKRGQFY